MATPTKIRKAIKQTLVSNLRIDSFGLNKPESIRDVTKPPSIASEMASGSWTIQDMLGTGNGSLFNCKTTLSYEIVFRLDSSYKYTDIDRGVAEGVGLLLCIKMRQAPECIEPGILELDPSFKFIISEETNNDWLVVFQFDFSLTFEASVQEIEQELEESVYK